jgi:hypothetical protein
MGLNKENRTKKIGPLKARLPTKAGYTHSGIGRTMSVRFMSHQVVEYKL